MTIAQHASTGIRVSSRWLLLGSLALNLFFIGIALAMTVRAPAPPTWDRDVFVRTERLAATLPPTDADLLRGDINANRATIESLQNKYYGAREAIRDTLRQEPFSTNAMRAAMAETRAARQAFDLVIQGVFAGSAAKMSPAGRRALADWPPGKKPASDKP
ncbi:MAG TPA: periplasmic heavy metal sensor [Pseudolabrys sp.]|nr:periplasmic heavy metal sensor [Pseudolabrys sp.]